MAPEDHRDPPVTEREARLLALLAQSIAVIDGLAEERRRSVRWWPGVSLYEMERQCIEQALAVTGGCQKTAAVLLGVSARVLNYRIQQKHGRAAVGLFVAEPEEQSA